jgi:lipoprotein-anchoring transpeptidase ErfK/SrfK
LATRGRRERRVPRLIAAALAAAAVAAAAGSGRALGLAEGGHQVATPVPVARRPAVTPAARCSGRTVALGSRRAAYAAVVPVRAVARSAPGRASVVQRLGRLDRHGLETVVGVVGVRFAARCRPAWYRIQLSIPPNGRTAWVTAASIRLFRVATRIEVSLSHRRLDLYRSGRRVLRVPVSIGAPATPTPTGRFFVDERYVLEDPSGPFGAAALGLSGHSTVLPHWAEGGPIALHGTNEPWLVGRAVSHGCVRLRNVDVLRVLRLTPAGTPVRIRA